MREGARFIEGRPMQAGWSDPGRPPRSAGRLILVALAALTGVALMTDSLWRSSATYDEVMYLEVAARWWRTGDQADITGAGSPLLFWKLQQVPMLWALDHLGRGDWLDDPGRYEARLLPLARTSALAIWLVALGLVAYWSRKLYGPDAMVLASWWFALSPNLLAHGALVTMELPVLAAMTGMFLLSWQFLRTGSRRAFVAGAVVGGVAFSCKFTAAVVPPILGLLWLVRRWVNGERRPVRMVISVAGGMAAFAAIMMAADVVVTAGATLPISGRSGHHPSLEGRLGGSTTRWFGRVIETPVPQDWVGFAKQMMHQRSGAPGYLLGEVREKGWRHYYLVAMAVKVPLLFWVVLGGAGCWPAGSRRRGETGCCRSRRWRSWQSPRSGQRATWASATYCRWRRWQSSGSPVWRRGESAPAAGVVRPGRAGSRGCLDPPVRAVVFQRAGRRTDRRKAGSCRIRTSTGRRGSSRWRRCSASGPSCVT